MTSLDNKSKETAAVIVNEIGLIQLFSGLLFTLAGFGQMTIWAWGKHRNYKREFKDYPRNRKPIVPFLF